MDKAGAGCEKVGKIDVLHLHPFILLQAAAQRAAVSAWENSKNLKSDLWRGQKDKKDLNAYMQPSSSL